MSVPLSERNREEVKGRQNLNVSNLKSFRSPGHSDSAESVSGQDVLAAEITGTRQTNVRHDPRSNGRQTVRNKIQNIVAVISVFIELSSVFCFSLSLSVKKTNSLSHL